MDENNFRRLVKEFAKKLNNVLVVVDDFPTPYQLRKSKLPPGILLLGLYEAVPQTKAR